MDVLICDKTKITISLLLQGTILDRIDYNVEQTHIQVGQGYQQLQKADSYQRKNRKMVCILVLAAAIILMLFLLIIFKL